MRSEEISLYRNLFPPSGNVRLKINRIIREAHIIALQNHKKYRLEDGFI